MLQEPLRQLRLDPSQLPFQPKKAIHSSLLYISSLFHPRYITLLINDRFKLIAISNATVGPCLVRQSVLKAKFSTLCKCLSSLSVLKKIPHYANCFRFSLIFRTMQDYIRILKKAALCKSALSKSALNKDLLQYMNSGKEQKFHNYFCHFLYTLL